MIDAAFIRWAFPALPISEAPRWALVIQQERALRGERAGALLVHALAEGCNGPAGVVDRPAVVDADLVRR